MKYAGEFVGLLLGVIEQYGIIKIVSPSIESLSTTGNSR